MPTDTMLEAALRYHREGLNCIPCKTKDKAPAIEWEEYQTRISTRDEVEGWFGDDNRHTYNIGLVHCQLADERHFVALDFDHDQGLFATMKNEFPHLFTGRIERSGSGEGYHVPLLLDALPDFGHDSRRDRPKGNRTWKTANGICNLRCRWCQTVSPPSIHPSGGLYYFLQEGAITRTPNLAAVVTWLDELSPPAREKAVQRRREHPTVTGDTLLDAVKAAWPNAVAVFEHFGLAGNQRHEQNGETRLLGNGGLLIAADDPTTWYCFMDEAGGGVIEAWCWCRYGNSEAKRGRFREVLLEMAQAGNVDVARFYHKGDEQVAVNGDGDRQRWTREQGRWEGKR